MSHKLALYFLSQGGQHSRILDAEKPPGPRGWLVGRGSQADIVFSASRNPGYATVSKSHAYLNAKPSTDTTEGGTPIWHWFVTDWGARGEGSTNGVWIVRGTNSYRTPPGIPVALHEGDHLQFGNRAASVKVSFDIDDTESGEDEDGPPTSGGTIIPPKPTDSPHKPDSPWFVPSIFNPVWDWFSAKNSAEQFVFLLTAGAVAAVLIYVWKL